MTTTTPTPIAPGPSIPGPARHRPARNAAAVAAVAALIAAGGYGAVTILGTDAAPPRSVPAERSSPPNVATANDRAIEANRDTIAKLYGPQSATGVRAPTAPTARDRAINENRDSVAKLYGNAR